MEGNRGVGASRSYLLEVPPLSSPLTIHQMEFGQAEENLQGLGFMVPSHGISFPPSTAGLPFDNPTAVSSEKPTSKPWSNEEVCIYESMSRTFRISEKWLHFFWHAWLSSPLSSGSLYQIIRWGPRIPKLEMIKIALLEMVLIHGIYLYLSLSLSPSFPSSPLPQPKP